MFPGMGNPKQMAGMLKQFGIKTEELEAEKVTIESKGKKIVIKNPKITVMHVQGQKVFTIMGEPEEAANSASEDDVKLVMEQAGATKKQAEEALKKHNGDIAEAITELKK